MSKRSNTGQLIGTESAIAIDIESEALCSQENENLIVETKDELQIALAKKNLTLKIVKQNWRDSLYNAVSIAISMLSAPFNVGYSIPLLRHKTSEYMVGHRSKFMKKFKNMEEFSEYCKCLASSQMQGSSIPEAFALANALHVKIRIYYPLKISPEGFIYEEH